jgi:hypothetical protein
VRRAALLTGFALLSLAAAPGPARAASSYPPSTVITDIAWETNSSRWAAATFGGHVGAGQHAPDCPWAMGGSGCDTKVSYGS